MNKSVLNRKLSVIKSSNKLEFIDGSFPIYQLKNTKVEKLDLHQLRKVIEMNKSKHAKSNFS